MNTVFSGGNSSQGAALEAGNLLSLLMYVLTVQQALLVDIRTELRLQNEILRDGLNVQAVVDQYRNDPAYTN